MESAIAVFEALFHPGWLPRDTPLEVSRTDSVGLVVEIVAGPDAREECLIPKENVSRGCFLPG